MITGGFVAAVIGLLWIVAFLREPRRLAPLIPGLVEHLVGLILLIAGAILHFAGVRAPGRTPATAATGTTNNLAIAAFVLAFVAALSTKTQIE